MPKRRQDLSASILYAAGVTIDLPQAVDPRTNPSAPKLLERDLRNVLKYFARHNVGLDEDPAEMARKLWGLWKFGEL